MSEERLLSSSSDGESASSECSRKTSERIFDEIYADYLKNPLVGYLGMPQFQPILYEANPEEPSLKWRRIAARGHEHDERKKLIESVLGKKKADTFAKAASYYPGARYQTLDKALMYSLTPPRIRFSVPDDEPSPRFLFKDLPAESSNAWSFSPTSNTSSPNATITSPQSSPRLPPVTPERRSNSGLSEIFKTPERPVMSPVFDSSKIRRRNLSNVVSSVVQPKLMVSVVDSPNTSTNADVEAEQITIHPGTNYLSPFHARR